MTVTSPDSTTPQPFYLGQMAPPPLEPPKKSRLGLIIVLIVAGVVVVAGVAVAATVAVIAGGKPAASSSTYKPIYDNGANNGAAPVAPTTTGPTYADPLVADFQMAPKITQKQCFGSAGCNVSFTVDLTYVGKGAKPNSTWDITFDAVGTEDALTDTISLHFDGTGIHGTYDSTEENAQTKHSSDALTLKITSISLGFS